MLTHHSYEGHDLEEVVLDDVTNDAELRTSYHKRLFELLILYDGNDD